MLSAKGALAQMKPSYPDEALYLRLVDIISFLYLPYFFLSIHKQTSSLMPTCCRERKSYDLYQRHYLSSTVIPSTHLVTKFPLTSVESHLLPQPV